MDYYEKAKGIMDMDAMEVVGGVSEGRINDAMSTLSVNFPYSYKRFLKEFGGGDIGGEVVFGITGNEEDDVVIITKMERKAGLPKHLVMIGLWNDIPICMDTDKMEGEECPIVEVSGDYSVTEVIADSFGEFIYDYLCEE